MTDISTIMYVLRDALDTDLGRLADWARHDTKAKGEEPYIQRAVRVVIQSGEQVRREGEKITTEAYMEAFNKHPIWPRVPGYIREMLVEEVDRLAATLPHTPARLQGRKRRVG